jgi:citrate/tricarballylate utilization protein
VGPGSFYVVAPYAALVSTASAIVVYGLLVFLVGGLKFWRATGSGLRDLVDLPALWQATSDAFDLRYLKGGGSGCYYPSDRRSQARRVYHSLVFYGFLADLASTTLAAIYQDILDIMPPFPVLSLPVILGTLGGIAMIAGCVGLLYLKWQSDRTPAVERMTSMDVAFLVTLILASVTGLVTLLFRETAAMGVLFALHLGVVAGLFITMPYGKFAHVVYRYAALVQNRLEQRRALRLAAATGGH